MISGFKMVTLTLIKTFFMLNNWSIWHQLLSWGTCTLQFTSLQLKLHCLCFLGGFILISYLLAFGFISIVIESPHIIAYIRIEFLIRFYACINLLFYYSPSNIVLLNLLSFLIKNHIWEWLKSWDDWILKNTSYFVKFEIM